ncbi:MAG: LysR family transcriptional regulator [Sporolactobacillus sp.]
MEIRHLHYFVSVYQDLHFSKAAEKLGISQPTLSQQIRVLEGEIGARVFDRVGKKIYPTQAGELLYRTAERIFTEIDKFDDDLAALKENLGGILRLGFSCNESIRNVIIQYNRLHPDIVIQVNEKSTKETIKDIVQRNKEIGVVRSSYHLPELTAIPLYTEYFSLVAKRKLVEDQLKKNTLSIRDVISMPLALYPSNFLIREMLDDEATKQGLSLTPKFEFSTMDSLIKFAENGMAATILPNSFIYKVSGDDVVCLPLAKEDFSQRVQIVYMKGRPLSQAAVLFVELLQEHYRAQSLVN